MKKQLKLNVNDTASFVVWNEVERLYRKNVWKECIEKSCVEKIVFKSTCC